VSEGRPTKTIDRADAVVIGAGMAGLTAARELVRAGLSVIVVEAGDRIGGRLRTIRDFSGQPVEAGAEFIHGNDAATWAEIRAAGLNTRPSPLVRNTMLEFGGPARWLPLALLHPGTWAAADILRSIGRIQPPDHSARELLDRRRDRGRARLLAQMALTAHLPGSIDEIGMLGLKSDGVHRLETGLNHRVVEGYDQVAQFVARDLDIRFSSRTPRAPAHPPSQESAKTRQRRSPFGTSAVCFRMPRLRESWWPTDASIGQQIPSPGAATASFASAVWARGKCSRPPTLALCYGLGLRPSHLPLPKPSRRPTSVVFARLARRADCSGYEKR